MEKEADINKRYNKAQQDNGASLGLSSIFSTLGTLSPFNVKLGLLNYWYKKKTDNQPTDTPSYRDARMHLKIAYSHV